MPNLTRLQSLVVLLTLSITVTAFYQVEAQQLDLVVQLGHTGKVSEVAFSPDRKTWASGSEDSTIKLWSIEGAREIKILRGHTKWVWGLAFSPDGKTLASASLDKTIILWDVEIGRAIRTLTGHTEGVNSVAFSPDGETLASGGRDFTVRLWNVHTGQEIGGPLRSHTNWVYAVTFSPDGQTVASAGRDNTIKLWDVNSREEKKPLMGHTEDVLSVAFSPDGSRLASGSTDQTIRIWNLETREPLNIFNAHDGSVYSVAFSPDGQKLASGGGDRKIKLWDAESGEPITTFEGHKELVHSVKFSLDGKILASGSFDFTVKLWNVKNGQQLKSPDEHAVVVNAVAFSPDGKTLASAGDDATIKLWSLSTGQQTKAITGHTKQVNTVAFSPDGKLLASGGTDKTVRLWDRETGRQTKLMDQGTFVNTVAFSPDGKTLAAGGNDSSIKLWDVDTGHPIRSLESKTGDVYSIAFSPDGESLAYAGYTNRIIILNLKSGQVSKPLAVGSTDDWKGPIAFSPKGGILASGGSSDDIVLWDVKSGETKKVLYGHAGDVEAVAFSPDGEILASGSSDKTVKLWKVESGRLIKTFPGHANSIRSIAFSSDGKFLASGSDDATIKLWDTQKQKLLTTLISLDRDEWVVATPEGRFDTNKSLDRIKGLHWVIHTEVLEALPLDVFMRPYYEPRLLPRLLANDHFREVPPLESINPVQPNVKITGVKKDGPSKATATVTVEVENVERKYKRPKNPVVESGAKDLRLFRDGQLVGYRDGDLLGRKQSDTTGCAPIAGSASRCRAVFEHVRLPQQAGVRDVEFSAYAFNSSDVKSETSRFPLKFARGPLSHKGSVYLVSVGVSKYENPDWDLKFAANDAHLVDDTVAAKLRATGDYDNVVNVSLTSEEKVVNGRTRLIKNATKENFRKVMGLLAGRKLVASEITGIPNARKIKKATPEDVVLIFYSSHGYRDTERFYLFPYDTGAGRGRDPEAVVPRAISSDDLYQWLRDIDAGEIVLVIDACHAAAVTGKEFKPGPMGSRGMGQLAYDKGMRILAATQPDTTAAEVDYVNQKRKIKNGLLTYALVEDGLVCRLADTNNNQTILLSEWLEYGVIDVPALYADAAKQTQQGVAELGRFILRADGDFSTQQPTLFDFTDKLRRKRRLPVEEKRDARVLNCSRLRDLTPGEKCLTRPPG
jgi:WD40 repeat protein